MLIEILQTKSFERWFASVVDSQSRGRINARIRRLSLGNPGDVRPVGSGVSEMRIDFGPGYRIYYVGKSESKVVLLLGGEKHSQRNDIRRALQLAKNL